MGKFYRLFLSLLSLLSFSLAVFACRDSRSSASPPRVCLYSSCPLAFPLSLWPILGGHSRSNSGGSESSLPSLARSLLLVDQLIDL